MRSLTFCKLICMAALAAGILPAAPALTTIQDTLYKADGTRFNGVAFIDWKSFETSNQTYIPTQSVVANIVDGELLVRLAPTTNASQPAHYTVRYSSEGRIVFTETWNVPPSTVPLKLRDVRQSNYTSTGGSVPQQITIAEVQGLETELSARPVKGAGYAVSRVAVIGVDGSLESALGSAMDCVRVDGTSGPCGTGGGSSSSFVDAEMPAGVVDGSNAAFTLASAPDPAGSLQLYRNGLLQKAGLDFSLSGAAITFASGAIPRAGDVLLASYRLASAGGVVQPPAGMSWAMPQVLCSSTGGSTGSATMTDLGTCSIPAGTLQAGDRVEVRFNYSHEGAGQGFQTEARWGGTAVASRSLGAGDSAVAGRMEMAIGTAAGSWSAESWTQAAGSLVPGAGSVAYAAGAAVTIQLRGQMGTSGSETVSLRGFTVLRYGTQANP